MRIAAIYIAGAILTVALSYLLALAGEPQAAWLWRDVFGIVQ